MGGGGKIPYVILFSPDLEYLSNRACGTDLPAQLPQRGVVSSWWLVRSTRQLEGQHCRHGPSYRRNRRSNMES